MRTGLPAVGNRRSLQYAHCYPHTDAHAHANRNAHADEDAVLDSNPYRDLNWDADRDRYSHGRTNADDCPDLNRDVSCANTHVNSDLHLDADANWHPKADRDIRSHPEPNANIRGTHPCGQHNVGPR